MPAMSVSAMAIGFVFVIYLSVHLYKRLVLAMIRRKIKAVHDCQPSYHRLPSKDPIFGLDRVYESMKAGREKRVNEMLRQRFDACGNTFTSKLLLVNAISTIEPENVKTVLSTRFKDYGLWRRFEFVGKLLGHGIFTSDGEAWAHSRAMLRPSFAKEQIADLATFERHIEQFFQLIPEDGSTVDLQDLFFRFTMDSATEFLFGQSVGSLKSRLARQPNLNGGVDDKDSNTDEAVKAKENPGDKFAAAMNIAQEAGMTRVRMLSLARFYYSKKEDEAVRTVHEFVDQFVEDAIRYRQSADLENTPVGKEKGQYLFLHELARATDDKLRLRSELLSVLLAGRDTTASLLSNMFFQIAKDPRIWEKLQSEVAHLNGIPPTYHQLRDLKYVKYCMNESLRFHPVVPSNLRTAVRDTVLPLGGGPDGKSSLFVPKGSIVVYQIYLMHRRKDMYGDDADEFRPERWETLRPGWEYLPFNGGPRICLGQQYALTEAAYVTTRILQRYSHIESRDPNDWQEEITLTMTSLNGTKVGLRRRED